MASMWQIERLADENNRLMINAVIWVERAGQKAIVIGQGGERLKEIGRLARIELNDLWQRSVHLELWVKVKENWADSEMALRQFGYDQRYERVRGTCRLAPAYVLHQYAYRDTSRIVEVFTGGAWTLDLVRARRQRTQVQPPGRAAALPTHARVLVRQGGACQMVTAEIDGLVTNLPPNRLMSGFYLNELLLKLTERCDPHPRDFLLLRLVRAGAVRRGDRGTRAAPVREALAERFGVWLGARQDR